MTRIRTLKPSWLDDELLAAEDDAARVLSAGLILLSDDHGRGRANPRWLASRVWPYHSSEVGLKRAELGLAALSRIGFCALYTVRGERYFALTTWTKHQRIDNAGKPAVPGPEDPDAVMDDKDSFAASCREMRRNAASRDLVPSLPSPDPDPALTPFAKFLAETWPDIREPGKAETAWREAFPAVDLLAAARQARAWEIADPKRRKTRHGRFLHTWFAREQQDAWRKHKGNGNGDNGSGADASYQERLARRQAAEREERTEQQKRAASLARGPSTPLRVGEGK